MRPRVLAGRLFLSFRRFSEGKSFPAGIGALASLSPRAARGVRAGVGAYGMFSENRRQKKLSELMAEYYGGGAGEKVETPSNAGDPAFGSEGGTDMMFRPSMELTGAGSDRVLGLGGGGRGLTDTLDTPEPSMTAGMELSPNKISTLLSKKAAAPEEGVMDREQFLARMAASGAISPMQMESLRAQGMARETSETRYEEGKTESRERYEDTLEFRTGQEARSERGLELSESAAARAETREGRIAADNATDNARAERMMEMTEERFEMTKAQFEASKQLDAREVSSILSAANSSIGDMELRLRFADDSDKPALEEQLERFRRMASTLQSMLESSVAAGAEALGVAPGGQVKRRRFDSTGTEIQ